MIERIVCRCGRWRFALPILLLVVAAPVQADRPQDTPGVPAGTALPEAASASEDAGPPAWTGQAYRQGVVAVSHPLAAEAGARALERGGNAIDAAAAIQFALNVVEPQFSGIGGGGFMMIHLAKTNQTFAIDCREKAPAAATPDMFLDLTKPGNPPFSFTDASTSGIAVGVPGTPMCLHTALKHWGTTRLADAVQSAIKLADEGFRINKFLAADTASSRTAIQPETKAKENVRIGKRRKTNRKKKKIELKR